MLATTTTPAIPGAKYPLAVGEHTFDLRNFIGKRSEFVQLPIALAGNQMGNLACEITILPQGDLDPAFTAMR